MRRDHDFGRSGLRVPEHELREIAARYVGEALHELLDRRGFAVMPLEIEVHALAKQFGAEQRLDHAHDLAALVVDGGRVEVVDLVIELGPHRVGERSGILDELMRAQRAHVADALHRARAHIGGKFLVAKDRQSFLQAELKPVAAGDAIPGPVVEVFVRDHRLDMRIVGIGRGRRRSQHVFVVEDIEALVLHRAHVEGGDGDDHENIEIVFAAESLLVPAHGALEAVHGVVAAVLFAGLHIDVERNIAPGHGAKAVGDAGKLTADQREQIAGLLERIVPDREMPVGAGHVALGDQIAVGEKDRRFAFVGLDARGVDRHHVGPVEEIGNAAETFGLALCAIGGACAVKSHELGVGRRIDHGLDLERERLVRRLRDGELVRRRHEGFGRQRLAVERERPELEFLAVEHQRRRRCSAVRLDAKLGADRGRGRVERNVELDGFDQPVRRAIVSEADGAGFFGAHDRLDVKALRAN